MLYIVFVLKDISLIDGCITRGEGNFKPHIEKKSSKLGKLFNVT